MITSMLDGIRGAWAGLTGWVSGAMTGLSGMLPGFVRDQLGITAPTVPVQAVPSVPAGPKFAQSNERRTPLFNPAVAAAAAMITGGSVGGAPLPAAATPAPWETPSQRAGADQPASRPTPAPMPNVWDIVSGDEVPARGGAAPVSANPTYNTPISLSIHANGVTDVDTLERRMREMLEVAMRDWERRQTNAAYGVLSD